MASSIERSGRLTTGAQQSAHLPIVEDVKSDDSSLQRPSADVSILHLLGGIPSPARTYPGSGYIAPSQPQGVPCCPPPLTPMPLTTPMSPPPPPNVPVLNYEAGPSYRDRLRAGGQGAFQRAFNAGIMPKSMKADWNGASQVADTQATLPQQVDVQNGMLMPCMMGNEPQQVWGAAAEMQSHDYWYVPMDQNHMSQQCMYTQSPDMLQMPPMPGQQSLMQMSSQAMLPQPQFGTSPMHHTNAATDLEKCMAIVMPQSAQLPCDKDLVAAQLRAVADCQCYED